MVQENELVTLIIGLGALIFFVVDYERRRAFPAWRWFLAAFAVHWVGWAFTVLEDLWHGQAAGPTLKDLFNLLEHACYAASAVLIAVWCWRAFLAGRREVRQ